MDDAEFHALSNAIPIMRIFGNGLGGCRIPGNKAGTNATAHASQYRLREIGAACVSSSCSSRSIRSSISKISDALKV